MYLVMKDREKGIGPFDTRRKAQEGDTDVELQTYGGHNISLGNVSSAHTMMKTQEVSGDMGVSDPGAKIWPSISEY